MKKTITKSIIMSTLLLIVKSAPTNNTTNVKSEQTTVITTITPETLVKEVVVSYIQNFKNAMAEYVLSEYKDLSEHEIDEVKNILEEFLIKFASDLKKSVDKQKKRNVNNKEDVKDSKEAKTEVTTPVINEEDEIKKLNEDAEKLAAIDGSSNAMFDDLKNKLRSEFSEINEFTAKEIVYHLRNNLFETRRKLDKVINDSKRSKAEIAQEERIEHEDSSTPVKELITTVS